ncbi:MAG: hypothetical protein ACYCYR_00800 [Desulfobulbaceae bacterium]
MTTESLQAIITAENELHAREREEETRAAQWLAEQEALIRAEFARQREALAAELERFRQQACEQAERRAAATRRGAGEQARRLAEVGDEELRGILARHLVAMVTGRSS